MEDVPWVLAAIVAGAMSTAIGTLWYALIAKDKQVTKLTDKYHRVMMELAAALAKDGREADLTPEGDGDGDS